MSDPTLVPPSSVVLVSVGSRGLGLAIVTDLIEQGVKVAAFARTVTPELTALAEKYPDQVHAGSVDVNDAAAGQDSLHVHTSADQISSIIQTNLTSPLSLTRFVLRRMMAKGLKGRIVNITSICAQRGYPGLVAYSATKGGMDSATRSLARELGGRVLANSVAPGFFASEMSAVLGQTQLEQIVRRTPTGHLTEPEEVVPVVRMLLLDNTNINGQVLVIDGAASI